MSKEWHEEVSSRESQIRCLKLDHGFHIPDIQGQIQDMWGFNK